MRKVILISAILVQTGLVAQWVENGDNMTTTDRVGIGTLDTSNGILTVNGDTYNGIRIENDTPGKEASLRLRSKSTSGATFHADLSIHHNGSNGFIGFKAPHNNNPGAGYKFIVNDLGNVGVGTTNPTSTLDVNGSLEFNGNLTYDGSFVVHNKDGNEHRAILCGGKTAQVANGGYIYVHGNDYSAFPGSVAMVAGHGGKIFMLNGHVGIGTTAPDAKLTVKGPIHAEEVKIDLTVPAPDYVFKEDYDLKSLKEVQDHIKKHGHLPNIPSAKEMEANGIELGEMNMKLLEKIEELTLYILKQEDELHKKNQKIMGLEEKHWEQEKRLQKIEKLLNGK